MSVVAPWAWIVTFLVRRPSSVPAAVVQLVVVTVVVAAVGVFVARARAARPRLVPQYRVDTAVLVATKDGAATIGAAVRSAVDQCPVYVVSDGSGDDTAFAAARAGAHVLDLLDNRGKPAALRALLDHRWKHLGGLRLGERYRNLVVIDDDTELRPGFVDRIASRLSAPGVAAVGGQVVSAWPRVGRLAWNPWVAARSWATWRTQFVLVQGQSVLGVRQHLSGASTGYQAAVLDRVVSTTTPYIVDDTYWCREIQREGLGRIEYDARAVATVQEPTTLRQLWKQDLRWAWGTWQGVLGHRIGLRPTRVDAGFWLSMLDLGLFVLLWPVLAVGAAVAGISLTDALAYYLAGYAVCGVVAALVRGNARMVVLWPAFAVYDWLYRIVVVVALVKAIRQPRVERCTWVSPTRYTAEPALSPAR
jgi:cellulose synthase/poly-beta-1,6-N-acetylglucosamine synthase-like glycosyltransferase